MKNSDHHRKHLRKKAIREAQKLTYETDPKQISESELHKQTCDPNTLLQKEHRITSSGKRSKMANPKEVTWETEPESLHQEGKRWMETSKKQSLDKGYRLRDKMIKRRSNNGKVA